MSQQADTAAPVWAEPVPEMGLGVRRLTGGPKEHKHTYHLFCPWSVDGRRLLLFRYDRVDPAGEICILDLADGELRVIGRSASWTTHSAAMQQWQGDLDRVLYTHKADDGAGVVVSVAADGTDERRFPTASTAIQCLPDGSATLCTTPFAELFPGDRIAPRHDKGLLKLDLDTGATELLASVEDALALHPRREEIRDYHMHIKMTIPHRRAGRLLFNFVNSIWDTPLNEERIRTIYSANVDGTGLVHIGAVRHHPNWRPTDDVILGNVLDFNGVLRFGLYRGDGSGLLEYIPGLVGSGHPSYSPDARWLCTDRYGLSGRPHDSSVVVCDPATGREWAVAEYDCVSGGYVAFQAVAKRAQGVTVVDALEAARDRGYETWQTQAHPAWSRDGRFILFNCDRGAGSQLYLIDVEAALAE